MTSVKPELNRLQIFKVKEKQEHQSGGKSGSFFFFTEDKQFIIKTMFRHEKNILLKTLPPLVTHLIDSGGKSLISRNYGAFRIKSKGMNPIYIML